MHLIAFYFVLLFAKPVPPPQVRPPEIPEFLIHGSDNVMAYRMYLHEGDFLLVQEHRYNLKDGSEYWGTFSLSQADLMSGKWAEPYYEGK
jgi:hypothetical protein